MKRPLLIVAIGYIIGIVWGLYCNCSIALLYIMIMLLYLISKIMSKPHKKLKLFSIKRYFRYIKIFLEFKVIVIIIITSIISNFIIINQNNKYNNLYKEIENVNSIGVIVSNADKKDNNYIYKVKVENLNNNLKFKNTYLLLKVKSNLSIEYGDRVEVKGKFVEPSIQRNYKGFNYKEFLKTQKIYGTVKVTQIKVTQKKCGNVILMISNNIFLKIKKNIESVMPEKINKIVLGIMMGYTENIDEENKQDFRDSGIAHILAVSGLHITYITIGIIAILKKKFGKRKAKIITIFLLIIYMCISGITPSVFRATTINALILISGLLYRKNDTWNTIAISLLIILIYNPFLIKSVGVLLSYGGTIGIITLNETMLYLFEKIKVKNRKYKYKIKKRLEKPIKFIRESLSLTISVQIIIFPIVIIYFSTYGFSFIVTNILLSIIIVPLICIGLIIIIVSLISVEALKLTSFFYIPFIKLLSFISFIGKNLPLSRIYIIPPNLFQIVVYYFIVYLQNFIIKIYKSKEPSEFEYRIRNIVSLIKLKIRYNIKKVISVALIMGILFSILLIVPINLKIYFVDVGQGDSTLIITPKKKSILIDGGGNDNYDVGKKTLLPYLLSRKITKIDYVIISHFDQDHIGRNTNYYARTKSRKGNNRKTN